MVAKADRSGGGESVAAAAADSQSRRNKRFSKPSWLLCAIADMDERMKMLTRKIPKENTSDSFATRANSYYHERPQLLELLQDLYNSNLSLADRYCQALAKNHRESRCSSPIPPPRFETVSSRLSEGDIGEVVDSDAESSLSFRLPIFDQVPTKEIDAELLVADLVTKSVECEVVLNELTVVEKWWSESSRKIELQKNLLDVLESERLILLNNNATLGYRVSALAEENKGLASESLFLKRKAAELARCVLKTRDDCRVSMLSRKIEDLQGQIYGLEKRNKEYYGQLVKQDQEKCKGRKSNGGEVTLEDCLQGGGGRGRGGGARLGKCFSANVKRVGEKDGNGGVEGVRVSKLWDKVKKFDFLLCGPNSGSLLKKDVQEENNSILFAG